VTGTFDALLSGVASPGLFEWRGDLDRDLVAEAIATGWAAWPLDTSAVTSRQDFYDEVRSAWGLPPWFGDNLDALFDALGEMTSADVPGRGRLLVWDGSSSLAEVDPELAASVLGVLRDAIDAADDFSVVLRVAPMVTGSDGLL
jgi:RNAse (barnase) inhibitor barstar